LRRDRLGKRVLPAALEQAAVVAGRTERSAILEYAAIEIREDEPVVAESEAAAAAVAHELNAIVARQRELARTFRVESGRQPAAAVDGDPEGGTP
jgi:hypothetical protein